MALTVYTIPHPENQRHLKLFITAAYAGVTLDVNPNFTPLQDNETKDYMQNCHPLGRLPALKTPEGFIFESNSIVRHIARIATKSNSHLYGHTSFEASLVDSWLDYETNELTPFIRRYSAAALRGVLPIPADTETIVNEHMGGLDNWLENRTFLVGERLTMADIVVTCAVHTLYRLAPYSIAEQASKRYRNVWRLYNTVFQQPTVVEVLKAEGATFGLPPKPKQEKPKAEPKPKKEKKEDAEEDDEPPPPKKKANPLDDLPPTKLSLETWKREYSNNDTRTGAAPWFFENYDPEGYTCFWAIYKYNEECKQQFMTANLCRGWFQRMEGNRKYAFGIALIVGEEKQHEIRTFWVLRGKGLPECVLDVPDTELFDWIEIPDINAEKDKITDYLCWEGPTIDKPVLEGRAFK